MACETYRRWAAGRCPCCSGDIDDWIDGTPPKTLGEGVQICGRCAANNHDEHPKFASAMLEAIARRDDGPVDRLIDAVST